MHLVVPKSFNDAQDVADKFKDSIPVIINLQSSDPDLSKRLIDFASGLTYALDGGMQRIADKVFLLTPRNVEVSAEERAALIEKGFFNQSDQTHRPHMQVGFIGAGNMAGALARGWGDPILATDRGSGRARTLVAELGGEVARLQPRGRRARRPAVLGHKPAQLEAVAREAGEAARGIVVSIVAGARGRRARGALPARDRLPRAAEPAGRGAQGRARCSRTTDEPRRATRVKALFARLGDGGRDPRDADARRQLDHRRRARLLGAVRRGLDGFRGASRHARGPSRHTCERNHGRDRRAAHTTTDTLALRRGVTSPGRHRPPAGSTRSSRAACAPRSRTPRDAVVGT